MRKLEIGEIHKHDCRCCDDCCVFSIYYGKYKKNKGGEKTINLYCKHEKCPYLRKDKRVNDYESMEKFKD